MITFRHIGQQLRATMTGSFQGMRQLISQATRCRQVIWTINYRLGKYVFGFYAWVLRRRLNAK